MTAFSELLTHIGHKIVGKADGVLGELAREGRTICHKSKSSKELRAIEKEVASLLDQQRTYFDLTIQELGVLLYKLENSDKLSIDEYKTVTKRYNKLLRENSANLSKYKLKLFVENGEVKLSYYDEGVTYILSYPDCKCLDYRRKVSGKILRDHHYRFKVDAEHDCEGDIITAKTTSAFVGSNSGNHYSISDKQALNDTTSEGVEITTERPIDYVEIKEHYVQNPNRVTDSFINPFGDKMYEVTIKQFMHNYVDRNAPVYSVLVSPYSLHSDFVSPVYVGEISYSVKDGKVYVLNEVIDDPKIIREMRSKISGFVDEINKRAQIYNNNVPRDNNAGKIKIGTPRTLKPDLIK